MISTRTLLLVGLSGALVTGLSVASEPPVKSPSYDAIVLADGPVAYWRFEDTGDGLVRDRSAGTTPANGKPRAGVDLDQPGPRPKRFRGFTPDNRSALFGEAGARIVVEDPGAASRFDFARGDAITLEAWVHPFEIRDGQQVYVVGKGRTARPGVPRDNQNWSLRLRGEGGSCRVSFLFRDRDNRAGEESDWHRWISDAGFPPASGWHHVAVSYRFGAAGSLRGYIDGRAVGGRWDMGGATDEGPVVDDDEVWIGSSLGGSAASTFPGLIDEVAIHRSELSPERVGARFTLDPSAAAEPTEIVPEKLPRGEVLVQLLEGVPARTSWSFPTPRVTEEYEEPAFGFVDVAKKYSDRGLVVDRSNPFLIRAFGRVRLEPGSHEILLRAFNAARLFVDGKLVVETPFSRGSTDGHEAVPELQTADFPGLHPAPPGHGQSVARLDHPGGEAVFRLDAFVGGKGIRREVGELFVGIGRTRSGSATVTRAPLSLLSPAARMQPLTEESWLDFARRSARRLGERNRVRRAAARTRDDAYWRKRHELAREFVRSLPAIEPPANAGATPIDRFLLARLEEAGVEPRPFLDDASFLRRLSLDTRGNVPAIDELEAFAADERPDRHARWIDRFLDAPGWADHWVPYWQDVLAENPGILKPQLNNTGPFRWWIHDSFTDGKSIDRFVTELILMEGSRYGGGPAGFSMASQNDAPMAAKAHIVGTAFLGVQMQCARCHDAPHHRFRQRDLFSLAALLKREALGVPNTSTVPGSAEDLRRLIITVSLKPGEKVPPVWPFDDVASESPPEEILRDSGNTRERLAARITWPANPRFARVIANRLWKRYMGYGLVEPVDDWEGAEVAQPELLDYLARQLTLEDYDLKRLARRILGSDAYRRRPRNRDAAGERRFAGPARRRLSAEQLVDSLFALAGKEIRSEALNMDVDNRRAVTTFLNLGSPSRAWEFASLSNERDRPALSMPVAQSVVDVLKTFGWRETRQDPITEREETMTPLQPLMLANGIVANRIATLSEGGTLTELCRLDLPLDALVRKLYLGILSRPPSAGEREMFEQLLAPGFEARIVEKRPAGLTDAGKKRHAVSWSNHLSAEATRIKLEMERGARRGDPPTWRLQPAWRERAEDMIWALINSPEFLFVP